MNVDVTKWMNIWSNIFHGFVDDKYGDYVDLGTNLTLLRPGKLVGSPLQHLTGPRPGALTAAEQPLEQLAGLDTENIINR